MSGAYPGSNLAGLFGGIILGIAFLTPTLLMGQTPLQQLDAGADAAVYSRYAASPDRSFSLLDQPYSFEYYIPGHGIVFGSEKGGHLSMAFEVVNNENIRPQTRYFVEDLNVRPRIQTSFSDFLTYTFKPFRFVRVQSDFLVYSSKFAIQEITLTNTWDESMQLDVYPFFQHQQGIRNVKMGPDSTYFTFKHSESLDGWGRRQDLPYPDSVFNVYMVSQKPRSLGAYPTLGPLNDDPTLPKQVNAETSIKQGGPVYLENGSLCLEMQPSARMVVYHNDSLEEALTQKAPQADGDTLNIPGNGTQQLELSHFAHPAVESGDTFTVQFLCSNQQGSVTATIPESSDSVGVELNLSSDDYVPPPDSVRLMPFPEYEGVDLRWNNREGYVYDIYRGASADPGHFTRIADSLNNSIYFDTQLDKYTAQTYILVARDSLGNRSIHSKEVRKPLPPPPPQPTRPFFYHVTDSSSLSNQIYPELKSVAGFQNRISIAGQSSTTLRIVRGKGWAHRDSLSSLVQQAGQLLNYDLQSASVQSESKYDRIPPVDVDPTQKGIYWHSFNQLRQGVMPSEGQMSYPYLIESRDAAKSWRKAGQSLYTTLSLLSLVKMDESLTQQIQRNYFEHQQQNGYIPHRLGPYLTEQAPNDQQNTSAAPWFSWLNWKIYLDSGDPMFLQDAYAAGQDFYSFWINERDQDGDGLSEWGGSAALESTREGYSVIWDQVTDPSNVEALGLNSILVMEARALSRMALEMGDTSAVNDWENKADQRAQQIRDVFWNETDQFFYHVDQSDHDFTVNTTGDLRRKEIVGFLPLWAGIASTSQADALINHLSNKQLFWQNNGIPSLSAADSSYRSIGSWNGPVWIPWQYFIYKGLKRYNQDQLAVSLVEKVANAAADKLVDVHTFKDRYNPNSGLSGSSNSSTTAAVLARMIWEAQGGVTAVPDPVSSKQSPEEFQLNQNYPNPFNPTTNISYKLPKSGKVTLTVYTINGRKVATLIQEDQKAGRHTVQFDAAHLSSGVYTYRLKTAEYSDTRKMLLLK